MPSQQTVEEVSHKLQNLKQLEENLAKTVSTKVNKLSGDCFKALATDSHNVSTMVMFRLDCFSEFLQNLLVKVQDASQQLEDGQESDQWSGFSKSISSLAERMDKLEKESEMHTAATLAERVDRLERDSKTCAEASQEAQVKQLQARVDQLASIVEQRQENVSVKGGNQVEDDLITELSDWRQRFEATETERLQMMNQLKREVERGDTERLQLQREVERGDVKRLQLKKDIERVDGERLGVENQIMQEMKRIEREREDFETSVDKELKRLNGEKTAVETKMKEEIDKIDRERKEEIDRERQATRARLRKIVDKQKKLKKSSNQKQIETQQSYTVLAKKVSTLQVLRDVVNEINQRAQSQPDTGKMVQDVQKEVTSLKSWQGRQDAQMINISRPQVGFTAVLRENIDIIDGEVIKHLSFMLCNTGDCYKPGESHFVAPHDGLYGFSVRVLSHCEKSSIGLYLHNEGGEPTALMCVPAYKTNPHSSFCVLDLRTNQKIFLKFLKVSGTGGIIDNGCLIFSGWSIGYH